MEIIRGWHNIRERHYGCVATIGNFDGVHLGHQAVLTSLKQQAQALKLPSTVILFEPHPQEFFAGDRAPARLSSFREKVMLLAEQGIDRLLVIAFNQWVSEVSADDFVQGLLLESLGIKALVIGDDFRFGHQRKGDFALLQKYGNEHDFTVTATSTFLHDDDRASSTRIRQYLQDGELTKAAELLHHTYQIMGKVVHGQQLGRSLGFATANVALNRRKPALKGVFAVRAKPAGKDWMMGVANLGSRPTVSGKKTLLEVHIFDFSGNLYGSNLQVEFVAKIRDEKQFADLHALKNQIEIDVAEAKKCLA